jgi:hypothetical protein
MANAIEVTKHFPASRERTVLLELLNVTNPPKMSLFAITISSVICLVDPVAPHVPPIRFQ